MGARQQHIYAGRHHLLQHLFFKTENGPPSFQTCTVASTTSRTSGVTPIPLDMSHDAIINNCCAWTTVAGFTWVLADFGAGRHRAHLRPRPRHPRTLASFRCRTCTSAISNAHDDAKSKLEIATRLQKMALELHPPSQPPLNQQELTDALNVKKYVNHLLVTLTTNPLEFTARLWRQSNFGNGLEFACSAHFRLCRFSEVERNCIF